MDPVLTCEDDDAYSVDDLEETGPGTAARVIRVMLAIYLLPVVAVVVAIGGVALAIGYVGQAAIGLTRSRAGRPDTGARPRPRLRHTPHLALPASVTSRVYR